jgi:thiol-disulfide isomerase/thioredoxin
VCCDPQTINCMRAVGKMFALLAAVFAAGAETFPLQLGELAPPLQLGTVIQGSAAPANAGKALVIEFWATWCIPCREAIPHLNQLAGQFKDRAIEFINITDERTNIVAAFLNHNHMDGIVATDPERKMGLAFGLTGLPMTVLVDRNGRIAAITDALNITVGGGVDPSSCDRPSPHGPALKSLDPAITPCHSMHSPRFQASNPVKPRFRLPQNRARTH